MRYWGARESEESKIEFEYDEKFGVYIMRKNGKFIGVSIHPPAHNVEIFEKKEGLQ